MNDRNDSLTRAAAALPRDIQPDRDLWPGVAARLHAAPATATGARRSRWPLALAAGVAVALVSSALTWWIALPDQAAPLPLMAAPTADPFAGDPELMRTRAALAAALETSLQRLAPATRDEIAANLLEIRQSLDAIRAALQRDPNNAFLHRLLHTTYQQELGLLSDINRLALTVPEEVEI